MLPEFYRFIVLNSTDQTLTYNSNARIEIHITPWKMSSGAMAQGTVISDTTSFLDEGESVAAAATVIGTTIDNTSDLFIGFTGTFYALADQNSTDGTLDLYMEFATTNSENPSVLRWPSDMGDFEVAKHCILLATLQLSTAAANQDAAVNVQY